MSLKADFIEEKPTSLLLPKPRYDGIRQKLGGVGVGVGG